MRKVLPAVLCLVFAAGASAQQLPFRAEPEARPQAYRDLAQRVLELYHGDQLFYVQLAAGRDDDALQTIAAIRANARNPQERANYTQYELLARAHHDAAELPRVFRETFARLDDRTAALAIRALTVDTSSFARDLEGALTKAKGTIALDDAVALLRAYAIDDAYRTLMPALAPLVAADDERRYVIERDLAVKTRDDATVCTIVVRPRAAQRLPALLNFTIYVQPNTNFGEARRSASNGYAGVVGLTRGKGCSAGAAVPYIHDGADAAALIDWIASQPWSDGRVGMYGGSYEGFTPWAATKFMPKALKGIMAGAPAAPGIDVPLENSVFWTFMYQWPLYTTNNKTLDDATYNDNGRWYKMMREWYVSGRAYRALDEIDGTPNPVFRTWLAHPSYDRFWQSTIPYKEEFARVDIPVLQTAGYYFGGPGAALYYAQQHFQYNPKAQHYLVIGPYDHLRGQRGTINSLGDTWSSVAGMQLDPVARLDMGELRYQWFDHLFKGAPKPALLQDRINYEVTGANRWKHAPSFAAMGPRRIRLYLAPGRLRATKSSASITLKVNLADRSDIDRTGPGGGLVSDAVDPWNGIVFESEPLPKATELSGLFSGRLDFITNKKDFDFEIDLFERTSTNQYIFLGQHWTRVSYAADREHRRLLQPGKRQRLDFTASRLMSRELAAGSRVVMIVSAIKNFGQQINYGSGKDVSEETIADAGKPLEIRWLGGSYIDLPAAN
ncbi:MAG TPA: CocE/NonD family hydrolase [Thermoanaerobaculia bacterium]|jgi:hypothetical protein